MLGKKISDSMHFGILFSEIWFPTLNLDTGTLNTLLNYIWMNMGKVQGHRLCLSSFTWFPQDFLVLRTLN